MLNFLNLQPEIFGIDVNDSSLKIVKLKKKHKGFVVVSVSEVDVNPGIIKEGVIQKEAELIEIIKKALASVKGKKLGTKYAVISLPEEKSFSQIIQMPRMTDAELRTAVPFEAENYIPLAIDKVYLDFQVIGDSKSIPNHMDLLINVMPKAIVDAYVSCFKKAGIKPYILEIESQAIARALIKANTQPSPLLIVDLGSANTSFIIFSGNSIRFTSSLPISSNQLTAVIADTLHISFAKAEELKIKKGLETKKGDKMPSITGAMDPILSDLAEQIKKYLVFYKDHVSSEHASLDGNIKKIMLCGGGANLKELPDFLSKKLRIAVEVGNPLTNVWVNKKANKNAISGPKAASFATAVGLALRGASEHV